MTYAKLENNVPKFASRYLTEADGTIVTNPTFAQYRVQGWKIFLNVSRPPATRREGWHYEQDGWTETATTIGPKWKLVKDAPPAPKVYDKYNLLAALKESGLLAAFLSLIGADAETEALWNAAETLPADDPLFKQVLGAAKTALGLTDEQIAALLAKAEIGA